MAPSAGWKGWLLLVPKEAAADGRNVSRRLITGTDADADAARSWHSGLKPGSNRNCPRFFMPLYWFFGLGFT